MSICGRSTESNQLKLIENFEVNEQLKLCEACSRSLQSIRNDFRHSKVVAGLGFGIQKSLQVLDACS